MFCFPKIVVNNYIVNDKKKHIFEVLKPGV